MKKKQVCTTDGIDALILLMAGAFIAWFVSFIISVIEHRPKPAFCSEPDYWVNEPLTGTPPSDTEKYSAALDCLNRVADLRLTSKYFGRFGKINDVCFYQAPRHIGGMYVEYGLRERADAGCFK